MITFFSIRVHVVSPPVLEHMFFSKFSPVLYFLYTLYFEVYTFSWGAECHITSSMQVSSHTIRCCCQSTTIMTCSFQTCKLVCNSITPPSPLILPISQVQLSPYLSRLIDDAISEQTATVCAPSVIDSPIYTPLDPLRPNHAEYVPSSPIYNPPGSPDYSPNSPVEYYNSNSPTYYPKSPGCNASPNYCPQTPPPSPVYVPIEKGNMITPLDTQLTITIPDTQATEMHYITQALGYCAKWQSQVSGETTCDDRTPLMEWETFYITQCINKSQNSSITVDDSHKVRASTWLLLISHKLELTRLTTVVQRYIVNMLTQLSWVDFDKYYLQSKYTPPVCM
jgi:hypothetical protein